jgi:uncharacterized membrane protein SpoIIM required for sporulation
LKEVVFIKNNEPYWKQFESFLKGDNEIDADSLAELYIHITDDLSYASTFYPDSPVVDYLNGIAIQAHQKIYKNKKEKRARFLDFWKYEVPLAVRRSHRPLFYSLLIFCVAIGIGLFSIQTNPDFVRGILGDAYVNMTENNIEQGDPLAVYKSSSQGSMFIGISTNNVRVSFLVYVMGILGSIPAAYILFSNGVMVGAFVGFFIQKGMSWIALSTIFIHGALELSAIVIAGGAGLVLGNSFLFPGTYSRKDSLLEGARRSLKIIIGLVPVFIVAAILESYVTRLYIELGDIGRSIIVIVSFAFIIWYFIFYPIKVERDGRTTSVADI